MNVHFIAIGEPAMYNLAIALQDKGYQITGSDETLDEPAKLRLEQKDLMPDHFGWFPEQIDASVDAIVIGCRVDRENPELIKAQKLGLNIYSYAEFLYEQSKHKTRVVIAGSKGKTTITAMILHVMDYHQIEVDYGIDADHNGSKQLVKLTASNDFIVLEGDENLSMVDGQPKFHSYQPNIALISDICWEEKDNFYPNEAYVQQFALFVDSIVKGGSITYNEEDEEVKRIVEASENTIRKLPYHMAAHSVEDGETLLETPEGPLPIEIYGKHHLNNLSGAKWICQHMGVDEDDFYEAISTFKTAN